MPGVIQPGQQQLTGAAARLLNGMTVRRPSIVCTHVPGTLSPDHLKRHGSVLKRTKTALINMDNELIIIATLVGANILSFGLGLIIGRMAWGRK